MDGHLHKAVPVPEVKEYYAAVIASAVDPTGQQSHSARRGEPQLAARMGSVHSLPPAYCYRSILSVTVAETAAMPSAPPGAGA